MIQPVTILLAVALSSSAALQSQGDILVQSYNKKAVNFGTKVKRAAPAKSTSLPVATAVAVNAVSKAAAPETNVLANKANGAPNTKVDLLGRPLVPSLLVGGVGLQGGFSGGALAGGFGGFGIGNVGGILGGVCQFLSLSNSRDSVG